MLPIGATVNMDGTALFVTVASIDDFDLDQLTNRAIVLNQHCYGCTAGAGSSCGGEIS